MNVEQRIRDLERRLALVETGDLNLRGRRAMSAGRALAADDLLTLGQAKELLESPEVSRIIEQHVTTIAGGPFGIPVSLGDTNQQGASQLYADSQHVHASGLTTKGDLLGYSTTTTRVAVSATNGESLYALSTATPGIAWGSGWKGAKSKTLSDGTTVDLFDVALPTLTMCGGAIIFQVRCSNGTDSQSIAGLTTYAAVNKGGVYTTDIDPLAPSSALSAGANTLTWTITSGSDKVTVQLSSNTNLATTHTTYDVRYFLFSCDAQTVTFL